MPNALQLAVAVAVKAGLGLVLLVVLRRGLHRRCWSFLVYLLAVLMYSSAELLGILFYDVPGLTWPRQLWSWHFWNFQQTVFAVIKMALAIELGLRVVAAFPGTWRLTRLMLGAALLSTTAIVIFAETPQQPLLATGAIWLFASTSLVVVMFNLPVHAWYRALLVGFVPYLFVFGTIQQLLVNLGLNVGRIFGSVDQVVYLVLVGWWAHAAGREEERVAGVSPVVLKRLGLVRA
jgi:hypothetical protein